MPLDLIGVNYRKDIDHRCRHYGDVIARSGSLMASALGATEGGFFKVSNVSAALPPARHGGSEVATEAR